jgi:shikimate kinase
MENMERWIDNVLGEILPEQIVAINFNLYEDGNNQWSIEMVGTSSFDAGDSDWACDEVYHTRDKLQSWIQESDWGEILQEVVNQIAKYLESGKYSDKLKSYAGVGVGFVDGDITIVYLR